MDKVWEFVRWCEKAVDILGVLFVVAFVIYIVLEYFGVVV